MLACLLALHGLPACFALLGLACLVCEDCAWFARSRSSWSSHRRCLVCLVPFTLRGLRKLYFARSLAELDWVARTELLILACLASLSLRALLGLLGLRRLRLARSLACLLAYFGLLCSLILMCFAWLTCEARAVELNQTTPSTYMPWFGLSWLVSCFP